MSTAEQLASEPTQNAEETDPIIGKVLNDKFKVFSLIATGGMGTIYRGEQLTLQRPVAIKILSPTQVASQVDPNFHKRFFLEASILSRLQHPNIVTVFDYGKIDGMSPERYFMAMEYLQGETLFRHLRSRGFLTPPEAIGIARQIARGLRDAHKHGVVHRDLKPSNIMLVPGEDGGDLVKILDFGLVKVLADDSEELTQQGAFLGSPRYMSPEQISHGKVDLRTDVYSLGVILYQLLSGKVPFESEKSVQILIAHLQSPVPPMRERNPEVDIPEPLENFVMSCLAKNPDARPSNMDAFIRALGDCAHAIGLSGQFGTTGVVTIDSVSSIRVGPTPTGSAAIIEGISQSGKQPSLSGTDPAISGELAAARTLNGMDSGSSTSLRRAEIEGAMPPAAPEKNNKAILLVGALSIAAIAAVVGSQMGGTPPVAPPVTAATNPVVPTPVPTPAVTEAPKPQSPRSFGLVIESTPPGAEVKEGDKVIGTTPFRLSIDNDAAEKAPRLFSIQKEGYLPYSISQGPSDKDEVKLSAKLEPEPRVARPGPRTTPKPPTTTTTPPPPNTLGIAPER